MDSSASDQISRNKYTLSKFTCSQSLPIVMLANGSHTMATGVGQANSLPSLTLNNVLFVPSRPLSLLSISHLAKALNCFLSFFSDFFVIQDLSTKRIIGKRHESDGLYYLDSHKSSTVCSVSNSPNLIHKRLGYPRVSKLQKIVPVLSKLSKLDCESRKHTQATFRVVLIIMQSLFSI